jgi:hypothetical protein
VRWGDAFFPPGFTRARTWLNGRINEDLYRAFEDLSRSAPDLTLGQRMRGRWLQLQATDGPMDAVRFCAMMAQLARFKILQAARGGGSGTPGKQQGSDSPRIL